MFTDFAPSDARGVIAVSGQPFDETVAFFVDEVGMRLELITPADDPSIAIVGGFGLALRIDRSVAPSPLTLCIQGRSADPVPQRVAPNGMTITFAPHPTEVSATEVVVPDLEPALAISIAGDERSWVTGRAGMRYRDLIPSRLGGRFIASHIEVCDGGPVPDMVHHHAVRFQMIFCHRGWVDVVYEDQGPPFRLLPGDCVLQPPHIRHKVLASSAGAQVIEIGCPAVHDTLFDHTLELPNESFAPDRFFGGQQFVRHDSTQVGWTPSVHPGFEAQHTNIAQATNGLASVRIVRANGQAATAPTRHNGELWFIFVLDGTAEFAVDGAVNSAPLAVGDSVVVPAGLTWSLRHASDDLVLLEVVLPG